MENHKLKIHIGAEPATIQDQSKTRFTTRSGIVVSYDLTTDVLKVGEVDISPQFFELLYDSAKNGETIKMELSEGQPLFDVIKSDEKPASISVNRLTTIIGHLPDPVQQRHNILVPYDSRFGIRSLEFFVSNGDMGIGFEWRLKL